MNNLTLFTLLSILALVANSQAGKKSLYNKDDNIHKSEALKWKDKQTLTLVDCQNLISRILMHQYKEYYTPFLFGNGSNQDPGSLPMCPPKSFRRVAADTNLRDWPVGCEPPSSGHTNWWGVASKIMSGIKIPDDPGVFPALSVLFGVFSKIPWFSGGDPMNDYMNKLDDCILQMINERIEANELSDAKELLEEHSGYMEVFWLAFLNTPITQASISIASTNLIKMEIFVDLIKTKFTSDVYGYKHEKFFDLLLDGIITETFAKVIFVKTVFELYDAEEAMAYAIDSRLKIEKRKETLLENNKGSFSLPRIMDESAFHDWPSKISSDHNGCSDNSHFGDCFCSGNLDCYVDDHYQNCRVADLKRQCGYCSRQQCSSPDICAGAYQNSKKYAEYQYQAILDKIADANKFFTYSINQLLEIEKPKTTTTTTTTTTPKPTTTVPSECENYHVFDQDDRNEYSSEEGWFCDSSDKHTSKDWHGEGWYRFTGKAGKQMADSAPCNWCCGTGGTGWLNGDHPSVHDGIVERQVCFSYEDSNDHYDKCTWKTTANVRNCGDFYVYQLQETPECVLRYCGKGI